MVEMYIKDISGRYVDAYKGTFSVGSKTYQYSLKMGEGFMAQLRAPLNIKEAIENNCRLKNGVVRTIAKQCYDAKDMSLTFQIYADTREEANAKLERLYTLFYQKTFDIAVDGIIYHLSYLGQNGSFTHSASWSSLSVTAKFKECDPTDRETYEIRHNSFVITGKKKPTFLNTYHITIQYNAEQCSMNVESGDYDEGTELTMLVTPKSGYAFDAWVDSLSNHNNPRTIIVRGDATYEPTLIKRVDPFDPVKPIDPTSPVDADVSAVAKDNESFDDTTD